MTTKESINEIIERTCETSDDRPIFCIYLFEHPNKEKIYPSGKHSGFPDEGDSDIPGFYYSLDEAIEVMNKNICDIRECVYNAGFILCQFPGMYQVVETDLRMYFVWDEEKGGFFQQEEPEIFRHVAYQKQKVV